MRQSRAADVGGNFLFYVFLIVCFFNARIQETLESSTDTDWIMK